MIPTGQSLAFSRFWTIAPRNPLNSRDSNWRRDIYPPRPTHVQADRIEWYHSASVCTFE